MGGGTKSMKILVFGGSPKGAQSVTMQYVKWLSENNTQHDFEIIQVAASIRKLQKNQEEMMAISQKVRAADAILWAFPPYIGMPHAGLKRFVELINECSIADAFCGKHCAILTTSIHFFDHTAVEYMRGVSEDFGMIIDEIFSAEMQDLMRPGGTEQLNQFFQKWMRTIKNGSTVCRRTAPIQYNAKPYIPSNIKPKVYPIRVGIVTQSGIDANLDHMVNRITAHFEESKVFDLSRIHIAGNCTGCLHCGYSNVCMYENKDDVISIWRELREYDAVLFCGFVVDRYFSARWKTFIDRMFFNTHMPVLPGKPIGFVVSGPLSQLSNLQNTLEGFYEVMEMRSAGFASDEYDNVESGIAALADSLSALTETGYTAPNLFPAIGGRKVFRDVVFGGRFGGFLMRTAMHIPSVRKNMQDNMKRNLLISYLPMIVVVVILILSLTYVIFLSRRNRNKKNNYPKLNYRHTFSGKLYIYVLRTKEELEIPPLIFDLLRRSSRKQLTLFEIMQECRVPAVFPGIEHICYGYASNYDDPFEI